MESYTHRAKFSIEGYFMKKASFSAPQADFSFLSVSKESINDECRTPTELNDMKTVKVHRRGVREEHLRRLKSERALELELPWHFEKDVAYHCISFGDVDSLTYLRAILKQQPVEWCLISTWCMALTDAVEINEWLKSGILGRVDFYVGEIFQGSYRSIDEYIVQNCIVPGARRAIFRNHSKVMAGYGKHFDFSIESSANIDTNPRTEQTVITTDSGVVEFYKNFFDGIVSFARDYDDWTPYKRV